MPHNRMRMQMSICKVEYAKDLELFNSHYMAFFNKKDTRQCGDILYSKMRESRNSTKLLTFRRRECDYILSMEFTI